MLAIEAKNLTFAYPGRDPALRGLSFTAETGCIFAIAGESGCGKTTLCHILSGVIPHAVNGDLAGSLALMESALPLESLTRTSLLAGLVFQDADSQIVCSTVEDELAFGLENLCAPPEEIRLRVRELAMEFGFEGKLLANPSELSGGEKKLLTIAAALAPSPPVLILDEPMSGLDADGISLVNAAIVRQKQSGRTVVVAVHEPDEIGNPDACLRL